MLGAPFLSDDTNSEWAEVLEHANDNCVLMFPDVPCEIDFQITSSEWLFSFGFNLWRRFSLGKDKPTWRQESSTVESLKKE